MDTFILHCKTSFEMSNWGRLFSIDYAKDFMGLNHQIAIGFSVFEFEASVSTKDEHDFLSMELDASDLGGSI